MKDKTRFIQVMVGVCMITLTGCAIITNKENIRMENRKIFDHTTGRLVTSGDAEIYVEEIGISDGPVLLMLHGGCANPFTSL